MSRSPRRDPRFSVRDEPWLKSGGFEADPAEARPASPPGVEEDIDVIRDSVLSEPVYACNGRRNAAFGNWLREGSKTTTLAGNLLYTCGAALLSGPFAVLGALIAGRQTTAAVVYAVLFGPVTEELLKQAGMIYLLERAPFRISSRWQLVAGAVIASLAFATIENLMYVHLYFSGLPPDMAATAAAFRWVVCTALHVACGVVASLGLIKTWRSMWACERPASLAVAFPYFLAAMAIHGAYNAVAILFRGLMFF